MMAIFSFFSLSFFPFIDKCAFVTAYKKINIYTEILTSSMVIEVLIAHKVHRQLIKRRH